MSTTFQLTSSPISQGMTLIEASAGTGKTYCLTRLAVRLLLEERVESLDRLVIVTFTNAATDELITRLRVLLNELLAAFDGTATGDAFLSEMVDRFGTVGREKIAVALAQFDEVPVFTIHGFCKRVLETFTFESGLPFEHEFIEDAKALLEEAAFDYWRKVCYSDEIFASIAVAKRWAPEGFLKYYRDWRRYPNTVIRPEPQTLVRAMAQLRDAKACFHQAFQAEDFGAFLDTLAFKKSSPFAEHDREGLLAELEKFCASDRFNGLATVEICTNQDLLNGLNARQKKPKKTAHPVLDAGDAINDAVAQLELSIIQGLLDSIQEQFARSKRERHLIAFDDLLTQVHSALSDRTANSELRARLQEKYDAALIDEFQDTDPIQCDIFRWIFESKTLVFVGDPKQAIYSFRGADIFAYLRAKAQAKQCYALSQNWRSSSAMIAGVNGAFQQRARPFLNEQIEFEPVIPGPDADKVQLNGDDRKALHWWYVPPLQNKNGQYKLRAKGDAEAIILSQLVSELLHLLNNGVCIGERPVNTGDVAVLVRTNSQAQAVQDRLSAANIPSVISQAGDILQSKEMDEWKLILCAIVNTRDSALMLAALSTELWGGRAADIDRLHQDDQAWQKVVEQFQEYREVWQVSGFMPMAQRIVNEQDMRERLLSYADGERRLTNLLHVIEFIQNNVSQRKLSPEVLLQWLSSLEQREVDDKERTELRLESDRDAVQIVTIHKSKGLEYPIVFCPYLWEGRDTANEVKPVHDPNGKVVMDFGSEQKDTYDRLAESERLAEDMRLLYVALTRAVYRTYVAWGPLGTRNGARQAALTYLLIQPESETLFMEEWVEQAMAFINSTSLDWKPTLEELVAAHQESMGLSICEKEQAPGAWTPAKEAEAVLAARTFRFARGASLWGWEMASFSLISMGASHAASEKEDTALLSETEIEEKRSGLFALPKGTRTGLCLHQILEELAFEVEDSATHAEVITRNLKAYGYDQADAWDGQAEPDRIVAEMVETVRTQALPHVDFALKDTSKNARFAEWEFHLPLAASNVDAICKAFEEFGGPALKNYAAEMKHLPSRDLSGFATGTIDLLVAHGESWHVVDWKSNFLGATSEAYGDRQIEEAMCAGHYHLQYHLYVLAVHRYLKSRLADYDYDRHIGQVWYVFLRGLENSECGGIFHARPARALIDALERILLFDEVTNVG